MCGINAVGAQGSGCMFTLCHAPLKMAVLLHKMASVCKQALMTVEEIFKIQSCQKPNENDFLIFLINFAH